MVKNINEQNPKKENKNRYYKGLMIIGVFFIFIAFFNCIMITINGTYELSGATLYGIDAFLNAILVNLLAFSIGIIFFYNWGYKIKRERGERINYGRFRTNIQ